jgi:hypothetical protein
LGLLLCLAVLAVASGATVGPHLRLSDLRTCLSGDGQEDSSGLRSFSYTVNSRLDANVIELIVVSGPNPRPGRIEAILASGRKPRTRASFANVVITSYGPISPRGSKPSSKVVRQLIHDVSGDIARCVAQSR